MGIERKKCFGPKGKQQQFYYRCDDCKRITESEESPGIFRYTFPNWLKLAGGRTYCPECLKRRSMREKIIQYLQGIKCEWFPVEWDSFMYNYLGTQNIYIWPLDERRGYSEEELKTVKIRYEFESRKDGYSVGLNWKNDDKRHITFLDSFYCHYFTLDRCKLLLLNAVRSVDEARLRSTSEPLKVYRENYEVYVEKEKAWVGLHRSYCAKVRVVWENGEFK